MVVGLCGIFISFCILGLLQKRVILIIGEKCLQWLSLKKNKQYSNYSFPRITLLFVISIEYTRYISQYIHLCLKIKPALSPYLILNFQTDQMFLSVKNKTLNYFLMKNIIPKEKIYKLWESVKLINILKIVLMAINTNSQHKLEKYFKSISRTHPTSILS